MPFFFNLSRFGKRRYGTSEDDVIATGLAPDVPQRLAENGATVPLRYAP